MRRSQPIRVAPHRRPAGRRGVTAVLAMLFMILFSVLAVGFVAMVNTSVQVAGNDQRGTRALLAAESGMSFARYHLWDLDLPAGTTPETLFDAVEGQLAYRLNQTPNLNGGSIARVGDLIYIPSSPSQFISANDADGGRFRLVVEKAGQQLKVRSFGAVGTATANRGIELKYGIYQKPGKIFNFGVASRSPITLDSNARIRGAINPATGSVLSTTTRTNRPVTMRGNAEITGAVSMTNPNGWVDMSSNAKIAGSSNPAVYSASVFTGVEEPDFPVVDTSAFRPFAGNPAYGGQVVQPPPPGGERKFSSGVVRNLLIKANPDPTSWVVFDSNMDVEGVIYIETPNRVRFDSNVNIRGAIVVQNNPTGDVNRNTIEFRSNVKLNTLDTLPANSFYPPELRALTGSMILAPKFNVLFNSNFGMAGGSVVAGKTEFDSNATGLIKGSVINMEDTSVHFDSNAVITIESQGTSYLPSGLFFGSHYKPLPDSYLEVAPQ